MTAKSGRTLIVMPTYNERENIPQIVPLVTSSTDRGSRG
jgi:hypothetical protein